MKRLHVSFCVEQEYGHIVPTLGIALELARRGHRVSYPTTEPFSSLIRQVQARPLIIEALETRREFIAKAIKDNDCSSYNLEPEELRTFGRRLAEQKTARSLAQLEHLYRDDRPDVVIHTDCADTAGRTLASKWGLARILQHSQFIDPEILKLNPHFFDDHEIVLVTVPKFFQRDLEPFERDRRFRFVGFVPEGRSQVFGPWEPKNRESRPILVSATTGLLPQIEFCRTVLEAFRNQPWDVVLSISGSRDAVSTIDPTALPDIPQNVQLNRVAGNFQILESSRLFIGQGGQGATLEAIYWGVPQIVIPPTPYHYSVARRVSDLGLGTCLPISDFSQKSLIDHVNALQRDDETRHRVKDAGESMRAEKAAALAADTIEDYLSGHATGHFAVNR